MAIFHAAIDGKRQFVTLPAKMTEYSTVKLRESRLCALYLRELTDGCEAKRIINQLGRILQLRTPEHRP